MAAKTGLTRGVKNALARKEHHSMCSNTDCGFALPKYPGRYPKDCPSCGEPRAKAEESNCVSTVPELGETVDVAGEMGRVVEVDGDTAYVEFPDGTIQAVVA